MEADRFIQMAAKYGWVPTADDVELFTAGSLDVMRAVLRRQGWPKKADPA